MIRQCLIRLSSMPLLLELTVTVLISMLCFACIKYLREPYCNAHLCGIDIDSHVHKPGNTRELLRRLGKGLRPPLLCTPFHTDSKTPMFVTKYPPNQMPQKSLAY